jgi:hypothetical protein
MLAQRGDDVQHECTESWVWDICVQGGVRRGHTLNPTGPDVYSVQGCLSASLVVGYWALNFDSSVPSKEVLYESCLEDHETGR